MPKYFKITSPDGTSFYDSKTKYVAGKTVRKKVRENPVICSRDVFHASSTIMDALKYARIPLAIHVVEGDPVVSDDDKSGFFSLKVVETLPESEYDNLLGFRYREACNPVKPMKIENEVVNEDIASLMKWDSVRDSAWDSVWKSVWDSVNAYIGSLFLGVQEWKYVKHGAAYPFQPAVDLWKRGFVPVKIDGRWHLYGWRNGKAVSLYEDGVR